MVGRAPSPAAWSWERSSEKLHVGCTRVGCAGAPGKNVKLNVLPPSSSRPPQMRSPWSRSSAGIRVSSTPASIAFDRRAKNRRRSGGIGSSIGCFGPG